MIRGPSEGYTLDEERTSESVSLLADTVRSSPDDTGSMTTTESLSERTRNWVGMTTGMAIGIGVGVAMNQLAEGVALGIVFGVALDAAMRRNES